jgi:hypothetical protein
MAIVRSGSVISKQEYLSLIAEANIENDMYGDHYDDNADEYYPDSWLPSVSPAKERLLYFKARQKEIEENKVVDAMNMKRDEIVGSIKKYTHLNIGEFVVSLTMIGDVPEDRKFGKSSFTISVKQEKTKTPGGFPCRITCNMDFKKDNRFKSYPWVSQFDRQGVASGVPFEDTICIIKYLQLTQRLNAFT